MQLLARSSQKLPRKPARASEDEALRFVLHSVFAAALIAAPASLIAAPRTINDCEKIQAADAYNQCLALFGPVARGHAGGHSGYNRVDASSQDEGAAASSAGDKVAASTEEDSWRHHGRRHASRHRGRHHWASHGSTRHGHSHRHATAAANPHHKRITMAFIPRSGHVHLR